MEVRELIQAGLENIKRGTDRTLDGLNSAELKWQPKADANSIGLILLHMARYEDSTVQSLLQGKPQVWESGNWYKKMNKAINETGSHYTAEQVAAFVVPDVKDWQGYAEAVRQRTLEYLKNITPAQLDKKVDLPPMRLPPRVAPGGPNPPRRPPFEPIVGTMLLMMIIHLAHHVGEISYLRGLQRGMDG
ncbi:MAG: hypothetical protein A2144_07700 [Chloroflexi bacterium RBG_16_50_9]|nr:MAG: hypothetical protein A2144_07700 [Chloroflexi bacterium RBG_16_50_9]